MCVIAVQPVGVELSGNKFRNCWSRNKDGGGYSFIEDEKLVLKKGYFDQVEMLDEYRADLKANPDSPFLLHFRISTSGLVDATNSHPHWVRPDLVMAHNGHISGYGSKEMSDTLEFVKLVLSRMPDAWEDDELQSHLIERYIDHDKVAMLRADGEYFIINEDDGNWQDGLWFSNKSWEKAKTKRWNGHGVVHHGGKSSTSPAAFTACGWDDDDMYGVQGKLPGDNDRTWEMATIGTYLDQQCAYCDQRLGNDDANFCLELDAWYPVCIECIIDNEEELIQQGAIADAVTEVCDELFTAPEPEEKEKEAGPVTSAVMRMTANVFSS